MTGKGGVGKSTLSAALSWQLARAGRRVLTASFDPAHNLGDIFGVRLGHRKRKFAANLHLLEVDLARAADVHLKQNIALLQETYSYLQPLNMDRHFKILKYSPGSATAIR